MTFFDRPYEVFIILGAPDSTPVWNLILWQTLAESLTPFVACSRGKAGVRTTQYEASGKTISYGRLTWDNKSHLKWAHEDSLPDKGVKFLDVEAWAPSWTICERENLAPDFFLHVVNENNIGRAGKKLIFNQRIVCALASDLGEPATLALRGVLHSLANGLTAPVFAHTSRKWGKTLDGGGFTDAIQDMALSHLFKVGNPHERELSAATFTEPWRFILNANA